MCKVVYGTDIEKAYEAFAKCGLELNDIFLVTPCDDDGLDNDDDIFTFTVSGQTAKGDWFYGNLPIYESDLGDASAWGYAIETTLEDYGDLYVRSLDTYGYDYARNTPLYDEIAGVLEHAMDEFTRLGAVA